MCRMTHSYLEHSEHCEADVVKGGDSVVGAFPLLQALGHRQVAGVSTFVMMINDDVKVMGVFIICWLPFFVTNIVAGICPGCISNPELTFAVILHHHH